jgi:hypothetical protein
MHASRYGNQKPVLRDKIGTYSRNNRHCRRGSFCVESPETSKGTNDGVLLKGVKTVFLALGPDLVKYPLTRPF